MKTSYTFIRRENDYENETLIMNTDSLLLSDILEDFGYFLKGCGYNFKGSVGIIGEEDE